MEKNTLKYLLHCKIFVFNNGLQFQLRWSLMKPEWIYNDVNISSGRIRPHQTKSPVPNKKLLHARKIYKYYVLDREQYTNVRELPSIYIVTIHPIWSWNTDFSVLLLLEGIYVIDVGCDKPQKNVQQENQPAMNYRRMYSYWKLRLENEIWL